MSQKKRVEPYQQTSKTNRVSTLRERSLFSLSVLTLFVLCLNLTACQTEEEMNRQRYITEGTLVYQKNCANCHQNDGKGLAALYPPIAGSDYLADKAKVICLIKYGMEGPIVVKGKRYNRPMPAQLQLSDLEVAEIMTYMYNEWGGENSLTSAKEVAPVLQKCEDEYLKNQMPPSTLKTPVGLRMR